MTRLENVPDVLAKIIAVKEEELAIAKRALPFEELRDRARDMEPTRGFLSALKADASNKRKAAALIAEIKKASPSKGVIREDFNPRWIAERYAEGGATCLSVLTDAHFFQGSPEFLAQAREASGLPCLRKDFTIHRYQLYEARTLGADAILLIAACLDKSLLADLHAEAREVLGLDVLVEIHNEEEWHGIVESGCKPPLVGINNRDLRTFDVTLENTERLAPDVIKTGAFLVGESGIFTPEDVARIRATGAGAILVGESLMRQPDPGKAAEELIAR